MSEKWTDKLPSLMEGYEEAAPEGLWDAVQAGLAPKKRVFPWWYVAGGILAAAAAVVLAVILWKPAAAPSVVPGAALVQADVPSPAQADEPLHAVPRSDEPVVEVPTRNAPGSFVDTAPVVEVPVAEDAPVLEGQQPTDAQKPADQQKEPKTQDSWPREATAPALSAQNDGTMALESTPAAPKRSRLQVQIASGAYLAQAGSFSSGYGVPYNPGMDTKAGDASVSVPMLSRNRPSTTEGTHKQSVRVGLGVSYAFTPRWSVGSGLTYTVLRSDYATVSGNTTTNTTRYLHYLGIPLQAQFKAFEWWRLSVNIDAGPVFEFAVGSKLDTRAYIGDQLTTESRERPAVKDLRWSLGAGVDVQYQLFTYGALFLQPGFSWHIPNGGGLESYYTLHPFSFDFTFGFRFTL